MPKLKPLEYIFSLRNKGKKKQVTILGIKFYLKNLRNFNKKHYNMPINKNSICFSNFNGKGYGCNPKYIANEIIKRNLQYNLYWLTTPDNIKKGNFPTKINIININNKEAYKVLASSKIWIDNQRKIPHIRKGLIKKEKQIYIQTWHGALGIKRLDNDVSNFTKSENIEWINLAKEDSNFTDYLLLNSTFEEKTLKQALWFNNKAIKSGHPRNDIFFYSQDKKEEIKNKIFNQLNIDTNRKTLLYVPTFRDNKRLYCYGLNTKKLLNTLKEKFGKEWTILIRLHPRLVKFSSQLFQYNENVIDVSNYPDIQELLVTSDIAITDYSSCIFDFMLSRNPGFIFATDIEDFNTERGFYYPLESTPFPVATNNEELCQNILNFDNTKYKKEVEEFLKEKGCMEDGHASERVVDLIEQIMNS